MPSQVQGYRDGNTAATTSGTMATYSWPPQQQGSQPTSTTTLQPTAYYGYTIAPSASYDSHQPPHPAATSTQRSTSDVTTQGGNETKPQQRSPEEARQGGSAYSYTSGSNGSNPEAAPSQERVGPSPTPPTATNGYQTQPQVPRAPDGSTPTYGAPLQSHSTETLSSTTDKTTPSKRPVGATPAFTGQPTMPYTFFVNQPPPGYPQYAWAYRPGGPYPPPPPPQPTAHTVRRSNYSSHRQGGSSKTIAKKNEKGKIERVRAMSPSQLESNRRDEVANMGCTCKKSKCLKLYCQCFGASVVCGANCRCLVCFNTPDHEAERKEAVRTILSRNPAAFDTKFKKTTANGSSSTSGDKNSETEGNSEKVLSHKIGCKCRKSHCTKKYCECYNAGIRCSATCRCTGCQNMPPGGFGPDPRYGYPVPIPPAAPYAAAAAMMPCGTSVAAQKLAFLKNSSPNKPNFQPPVIASAGGPSGAVHMPPVVSSEATPTQKTANPEEGGVTNALLMAAYAMTELHADESPAPRASPKRKSPELAGDNGSTRFENPPPNPFSFPPDDGARDSASPVSSPITKQRKSKRSRVGTNKKKLPMSRKVGKTRGQKLAADEEDEPENKSPVSPPDQVEEDDSDLSTPMATRLRSRKKTSPKDVLTPVSARCIDFRRMDVKAKGKTESE